VSFDILHGADELATKMVISIEQPAAEALFVACMVFRFRQLVDAGVLA